MGAVTGGDARMSEGCATSALRREPPGAFRRGSEAPAAVRRPSRRIGIRAVHQIPVGGSSSGNTARLMMDGPWR